jgi:beta-xylosidase
VDATRSNACDRWETMGRPPRPTALEIRALRSDAQMEIVQDQVVKVEEDGSLSLSMRLPAHSVSLIELERVAEPQEK